MKKVQSSVDLGSRTVRQDQTDAQRRKQVAVVGKLLRHLAGDDLAAESDHEGLSSKGVNIGCCGTHPSHEGLGIDVTKRRNYG